MKLFALVAVLVLGGLTSRARADDSNYRIAIGATDAVGGAALVVGLETIDWFGSKDSAIPVVVALTGFGVAALGGPVVHGIHQNWGRLGISLATRIVLPPLGLLYGVTASTSTSHIHSMPRAALTGLIVGYLGVTAIDLAMAYRDSDPSTPRVISFGMRF